MADKKELTTKARKTLPAYCDVYEEDGDIILRLEMPGVSREHLDIKVEGNELKISGKREPRDEKARYLMKEIYDADFS